MAVAPDTAERIGSLPMESSASKSASVLDYEPPSPATISCDADSPDRSDLSDSSPNPNRDFEIQAALRNEEYRQLFRLPPEEAIVQDFNCAFQESILLQGHMYLFSHYICFYSNIFGFETKKVIPFIEVSSVKRAKTAGIFPNAIEIFAGERKLLIWQYFFASFLSRDEAFKLINDGWLQCVNGARAITEEQESMISGSSSLDNGIIIEKVNSFRGINELDSDDRDNDVSLSNDYMLSAPSAVEIERAPERLTEIKDNVKKDVEPVDYITSSSSTTSIWNEEDAEPPEIRKSYTRVGETKFPIKVEEFFNFFFSDDASNFIESFHQRCGDKEFRCSLWQPQEKLGHTRDVSFQHPIKIYFGAKFGSCQEKQKFQVYRNSHLVIETSQEINDVPYGDYFRVEGLWDVVKDADESNEGCLLQIYVDVAFSKKTVFKGKIVQSTLEECREAYATWINMAHELLKQKNLERREEGPNVIQNVEVHTEVALRSVETSEKSSQSNDRGRIAQMSGSLDVNERVGDLVQENFTNATAVASLLREYATRFSTFLRSQSQVSLILVVAFVVIFLMQVSILVLLNRPQTVQVASPGEYYMGGMGSSMGDRSTEAVAWLERRIHHLKDEMFMVEGQLERLRHEHNWIKAQLKDLDGLRNRN
ncbi:protein VASCULAR ASSOCIATED DEATH 1, chloroplastic isoform X1 [Ricinus communis]|uniref:protein VASCULAR ASSOCIATED DEATH 1, chloroplastic isoform X1 n=1 Tax=Ricinus communis TaxID=3988 RepID=UPI00201AF0FC|nr:protein VASCULAR ASSOCIATED DEATH 1, chloroplastic isoform X1 [Ricinus communis]